MFFIFVTKDYPVSRALIVTQTFCKHTKGKLLNFRCIKFKSINSKTSYLHQQILAVSIRSKLHLPGKAQITRITSQHTLFLDKQLPIIYLWPNTIELKSFQAKIILYRIMQILTGMKVDSNER